MSNGKQHPKCFVISADTTVDVSPASKFGDIRYLFDELDEEDYFVDDFELQCIHKLKHWEYNFNSDFIVIAGNITAVARLIAALMSEYEIIYTLVWSRTTYTYKQLQIGVSIPSEIQETTT